MTKKTFLITLSDAPCCKIQQYGKQRQYQRRAKYHKLRVCVSRKQNEERKNTANHKNAHTDPAALVFSYNNGFFHARSPFSEIAEFPPYQQSRQTRVLGGVAQDAVAPYAKSPVDQTH